MESINIIRKSVCFCIWSWSIWKNDSEWIKDVNHSFLKSLAVNNNGFYKRIKTSNADTVMSECFHGLAQPLLKDIKVQYHHKNIRDLTESKFNTFYEI